MKGFIKFTIVLIHIGNVSILSAQNNTMSWEFDNFKKLTFNYQQITTNKELFLEQSETSKSYAEISGQLMVEVMQGNSVDVTLKNAKITTFIKDSLENRFDTRSQVIPDMIYLRNLKENGSVVGLYDKRTELIAKILFPIINRSSIGSCLIQVPLNVSFDIDGVLVMLNGENTINISSIDLEDFRLSTHFYAKKDNIEIEKSKYYICEIEGETIFDFNNQRKYFTNGKIKLNMLLKQKKEKISISLVDIDIDITLKLVIVD